MNYFNW